MSKKFKGKTCVYCTIPGSSSVGDHVLAREFCLPDKRDNLPQVPACLACNGEKSKLEHYLTTVTPFGGRHADSSRNLATMVEPRLRNNRKLHSELLSGLRLSFESTDGVNWAETRTLPFDAQKLADLYEMMAKGLAFWHWGVLIPGDTCVSFGGLLRAEGEGYFEQLLAQRAGQRITGNLSDGVLVYEGAQAVDHHQFTVWRMSLYGVLLGGGADTGAEKPSRAYVITAPRSMPAANQLVRILEGVRGTLDPRST